jgi:O-antigen/teichoic acid export membrane protein
MKSFKQVTFNNVVYNAIAKGLTVVFQGIASIILTRTLLPEDYGIVGFSMIIVGSLLQFNDLGVNNALVQRKELDEKALYTGFVMRFGMSAALYAVAFVISFFVLAIFDNPAVVSVIKVAALNFIIQSFAFVPLTLLRRQLDFKRQAVSNVVYTIVNSTLSITLVLSGFKYWSIVLASLSANVAMVIVLNILKPAKLRFLFDRKMASEFLSFGGTLTVGGLIMHGVLNLDNFFVGTVLGSTMLGYYMIAFNWGSIICNMIGGIIYSVLFPTLSRMNGEKERMKKACLRITEYMGFAGLLINITLLLVSTEFLTHVLGRGTEKWLPALDTLRILCFYGIIRFLLEPAVCASIAMGKPNVMLKASALTAIIEFPLLYPILRYFGLEGIAVLVTVAYAAQYTVYFQFFKHELNLSFSEFISKLKPAIMSAIAVGVLIMVVQNLVEIQSIFGFLAELALSIGTFSFVYGSVTHWRLLKEVKSMIYGIKTT